MREESWQADEVPEVINTTCRPGSGIDVGGTEAKLTG